MNMNTLNVSIVIPNYNGEHFIKQNMPSVIEAADIYPAKSEIIVVDDDSRDNSVKILEENFPDIKIVRHEINKGFAETVHSGVTSSMYSIIILLNTDVIPDRNFISPLIEYFNREDTFAVSPLIRNEDGKSMRVSWNLVKLVRGELRRQDWNLEDALELARQGKVLKSFYASGGSVAIRKQMFEQLGGFLSIYKPFCSEDKDLCTRAWKRGWATYFEPTSMIVHAHEGTKERFFSHKRIKITKRRNRFFHLWCHLSTTKLIFSHFPWILYRFPMRILRFDMVYPIAFFKALSQLGTIVKLRDQLRSNNGLISLEEIIEKINLEK
jgi:GT2 family glycosyltransferase